MGFSGYVIAGEEPKVSSTPPSEPRLGPQSERIKSFRALGSLYSPAAALGLLTSQLTTSARWGVVAYSRFVEPILDLWLRSNRG